MKYGKVNGVIKPVSRIITGTGQFQKGQDPASLFEVFDRAYELGINTIDTGREYADGEVEMYIGRWLKQKKNRDNVVIISKGGHHSSIRKRVTPFDVTADIYDSLELLQTDYIDIYLLHRDDETKPVGPLVEMLNSHYEEGRIKTFGVSNWRMERIIEQMNTQNPMDCVHLHAAVNIFHWVNSMKIRGAEDVYH